MPDRSASEAGIPLFVRALEADAASNSTTTGVEITGLRIANLAPGYYVVEYFIRYQSSATTTGVKFGVNHTGTVSSIVLCTRWATTGTTATTNAATQSSTGNTLLEQAAARTATTTAPNLGPTASVDTLNADMLAVIEGVLVITAIGDLALWHASETANATTVKAGSTVRVTKGA